MEIVRHLQKQRHHHRVFPPRPLRPKMRARTDLLWSLDCLEIEIYMSLAHKYRHIREIQQFVVLYNIISFQIQFQAEWHDA